MRLKTTLLASCVGAVGFAMADTAEAGGFYGSVTGGYDLPSAKAMNATFSNSTTLGGGGTSTFRFSTSAVHFEKAENGFMVAVALGYDLSDVGAPGLRVELEGGYRHNNVQGGARAYAYSSSHTAGTFYHSASATATATGGHLAVWSVLANAWYEFDTGGSVRPYAGGGIGWAQSKFTIDQNYGPSLYRESQGDGFAWQLGGGFNVHLSDRASIGLGYRYFHADDLTVAVTNFGLVHPAPTFKLDGVHQDVTLSLSYGL
ncbi:MAG: outer membrane beta-barrel protein [Alphaproteobacteria bacterium]|nr:outer membrane beta-barrel protein [Alphaproteobacteria bacterium]